MKILYITYIGFDNSAKSGSSVRPQKMYDAFLELGYEVKLLECQQNQRKDRRKSVREILKWLNYNCVDLCYIESPSGPIFNYIDLLLIKRLHKMQIPIGYFYRDMFWLYPSTLKNMSFLKRTAITLMCKRDLKVLKRCCDIIYFPTEEIVDRFSFAKLKRTEILPPAADLNNLQFMNKNNLTYNCIYIGAVSKVDGTFELLKAFNFINRTRTENIKLTIVSRKEEWENLLPQIGNLPEWLIIEHKSGEELKQLYAHADLAIFPRQNDEYINVAMPVKLFEYISFGKPVITTKRTAPRRFIESEKCGIVCDDSGESIGRAILKFYDDAKLREQLYCNVERAARNNQWTNRVDKVITTLCDVLQNK